MKRETTGMFLAGLLCASILAGTVRTTAQERTAAGASAAVTAILENMALEEKIGQMLMPSFRTWNGQPDVEGSENIPVTELNDALRTCIAQSHLGGIILFAENCPENEQTRQLAEQMQEANRRGGENAVPLMIAIDQEGGAVARLGQGIRGIGNMALAASQDPENARKEGLLIGDELGALSVNTDFAPVVDVNVNPANPVIGVRSFSDDPGIVAEYGAALMEGLHEAGVICSLKHFPGHGDTSVDSHTGLPLVDKSEEELREVELYPFKALIDAGADMVMTAHIQYPQLETEKVLSTSTGEEIFLPATMSHHILTDILRGDMGFEGVIVSDALNMSAIADHFSWEDACRRTIEAGVDLLLMPVMVTDGQSVQQLNDLIVMVTDLVRNDVIPESRIDESVERILTVKEKYGLLDMEAAADPRIEAVGSSEHHDEEWALMQSAVTLLKNEDQTIPAVLGENAKVLFVYGAASRVNTAAFAKSRLVKAGIVPESAEFNALVCSGETKDECIAAAGRADLVIMGSTVFSKAELDPSTEEGAETAIFDEVIAAAHENGTRAVLISAYLPYDTARFQSADAILVSYGSSPMNELPEGRDTYMTNLPAAICAVFGEFKPTGKLPVDIPVLNEDYSYSDEILYERGSGL